MKIFSCSPKDLIEHWDVSKFEQKLDENLFYNISCRSHILMNSIK